MEAPIIDATHEEFERCLRVVMFDAGVRLVDCLEWLHQHATPHGMPWPASPYDCTGRWMLEPMRVCKVSGFPTFTQVAFCDV